MSLSSGPHQKYEPGPMQRRRINTEVNDMKLEGCAL